MSKKKTKANFIDTTDRKKRTETAFLNGGRENKAGFVEEGDSRVGNYSSPRKRGRWASSWGDVSVSKCLLDKHEGLNCPQHTEKLGTRMFACHPALGQKDTFLGLDGQPV